MLVSDLRKHVVYRFLDNSVHLVPNKGNLRENRQSQTDDSLRSAQTPPFHEAAAHLQGLRLGIHLTRGWLIAALLESLLTKKLD